MLDLDDPRWRGLSAAYRMPVDLRPFLAAVESADDREDQEAWDSLWQELYHQGDVGEGSFAAVPHVVRIYRQRSAIDWNPYALAASIELARGVGDNPDVPDWMSEGYQCALLELRDLGLEELPKADEAETVRSILAVLAITTGARAYGRMMLEYSEDELLEFEREASENDK